MVAAVALFASVTVTGYLPAAEYEVDTVCPEVLVVLVVVGQWPAESDPKFHCNGSVPVALNEQVVPEHDALVIVTAPVVPPPEVPPPDVLPLDQLPRPVTRSSPTSARLPLLPLVMSRKLMLLP